MTILNKIKNTKLIINIVVLILLYFFSFHIFPKLGFYNKLDYVGIETNSKKVFNGFLLNVESNVNLLNDKDRLTISMARDDFLKSYLDYLNLNTNLISNAPCPRELIANNLRNIQIYNDKIINYLDSDLKFNVRFIFYGFNQPDKLDINKCFDYLFKNNLNKYYLLYRERLIGDLYYKINFLKDLNSPFSEKIIDQIKISENQIRLLKNSNFFVNPDIQYAYVKKKDNQASKFIAFIILILIVIFINIYYSKKNKKITKYISKFINF